MTDAVNESRKVVIVGAGDVGASFAYALAQDGCAEVIRSATASVSPGGA